MTACIIKFPKNAVKLDPKSIAKETELEKILEEELAIMHEEEKLWEQRRRHVVCFFRLLTLTGHRFFQF